MTQEVVEQLDQLYEQPKADRTVPPDVTIIMLKNGAFWEGSTGVRPLTVPPEDVTLVAGVSSVLLAASSETNGARVLNYGASPVYLGTQDPPASGPPSEFVPPGTMDAYGNIWPGQFEFSYRPTDEWFALSAEDGQLAVFIW